MNQEINADNWPQLRAKVKTEWGRLTDVKLEMIAGQRKVLVGEIQECYGITHDEAEARLASFESR